METFRQTASLCDVVVRLPNDREIVVDGSASPQAYIESLEAGDGLTRSRLKDLAR